MEINTIEVTVGCICFNQEKYIRKTLDGFVRQKTNFNYEILIHDDASTDNTANIIREYQKKYPEKFVTILQDQNQHKLGKKITSEFIFPNAGGKYLALCEGDDYWTDEFKLQKQYDIMEKNPNCSICTHKIIKVREDGQETNVQFPPIKIEPGIICSEEYIVLRLKSWMFQTCSYFVRTEYVRELIEEKPDFYTLSPVGDLPLELYLMTKGNLYYIDKVMSHYRLKSDTSVTKRDGSDISRTKKRNDRIVASLEKYNQYTRNKYDGQIKDYISELRDSEFFTKSMLECSYKDILSSKCRKFYNRFSVPQKLFIRTMSIIPFGHKIGRFIQDNIKSR